MWSSKSLGDIVDILDKQRKPITKKNRVEGSIPYYGATGVVDWVKDYIFDEKLVLVGEDGAKWDKGDNTAFIVEGKTWVNNHAHVLRPKPDTVTHEWLTYYLTSIDLSPWVTGLTVPKLNQAQLRSIPIPLPPLAEQQRIVAKLDAAFAKIDGAIAGRISQRDSAKLLLNQYLATIAAEQIKLDDVVQIKTGKLDANAMVEGGKYPFFTCSKQIFEINDYAFDCDAVLLAGNNASGDFNVKHYEGKFNAYQRTYVLTVKDENKLRSRYLYFQLIQALAQFKRMSVGTNTKFLKLGMIKEFEIPLPEMEKQNLVLDKLEQLEAQAKSLEENFEAQIDNLTALKSAILAQELQSEAA